MNLNSCVKFVFVLINICFLFYNNSIFVILWIDSFVQVVNDQNLYRIYKVCGGSYTEILENVYILFSV